MFKKFYPIIYHLNADLIFLIPGISLLYFFNAGSYPLFTPDEGRYSEIAREMLINHNYFIPYINGSLFFDKPILFYWLQVIALKIFGLNEFGIRFFPILFAILLNLITYLFAKLVYDRPTAILSICILSTTPLFFGSAHYANLDMEITFWITLAMYSFWLSLHSPNTYTIHDDIFTTCCALGFLTKGLIGFVIPCGIIVALSIKQKNLLFKKMLTIRFLALAAILILPWLIYTEWHHKEFFSHFFFMQHFERFLDAKNFNNVQPSWFYIPIFLAGTFPWSIFFLFGVCMFCKIHHEIDVYLKYWMIFILLFFSLTVSKIVTYILPMIPPFAILTANYIKQNFTTYSTATKLLTPISLALTIFLSLGISLFGIRAGNLLSCVNMITIILLVGAGIMFYFRNLRQVKWFFCYWWLMALTMVLCLMINAKYLFPENSTKLLSKALHNRLQSRDILVTYYNYYYDLPIYLNRLLFITFDWQQRILKKDNWSREFYLGNDYQKNPWLIDEKRLISFWYGPKNVYVFLDQKHLDQFTKHIGPYHLISKDIDTFLITNKP